MTFSSTLEARFGQVDSLLTVRKADLGLGDLLVVETRNSRYEILSLGDGTFQVSGGWFDRSGVSPALTTINGCTWGGSAIRPDLAAGCGLFLEFGNRVMTTRIRALRVIPAVVSETIH